jgi:polyhydroxyalkanoate synthesis regulator phasin
MASARRKNSITKFLQDVIDDSKELVDDLIDRATEVEEHAHDAVRDIADDEDTPSGDELAELKAALAELTGKVEKLAAVKSKA